MSRYRHTTARTRGRQRHKRPIDLPDAPGSFDVDRGATALDRGVPERGGR
jgi:hypothetical protein